MISAVARLDAIAFDMIANIGSSTAANRLKRSLRDGKINCAVMQTPRSVSRSAGCSFSVSFDAKHKEEVIRAADQLGIALKGIYDDIP